MHIHLSAADGEPIYQQIVRQIRDRVATSRLLPGEELSPIRVLAEQTRLNPNTVARAYRELERAGILTTRRTAGTFVADGADERARAACREELGAQAKELVERARAAGANLNELLALVRRAWADGEKTT